MSSTATFNEAKVRVRTGPLVAPVLSRVVGMLAARAQCPIDRLDDAMLLTDAVAAHAPANARNAHVAISVRADDRELELRVGELAPDGAKGLVADAELPGVGNVFQQVADEIATERGEDSDDLVLRLTFRA
ncbi:MAG: hypothetical protein ABI950_10650 [Solirubrobacteraceae bacterium]